MATIRSHLAIAAALVLVISQPTFAEQTQAGGNESLGGRLLDDLPQESPQPVATPQDSATQKSKQEIEDSLKASTPLRGFGVRANPIAQPLARVQGNMKHAQGLLAKPVADAKMGTTQFAGAVQQEIISDLDKLIAELSKQCNGQCQGDGGQDGKQPPKPGQNSPSKSNKSGVAAGRGKSGARDSNDRLDRASAKPVDKGEVDEIVKALWGNLPERSREQMLQSFSDEFLPKYELEIEQYYRHLSEEVQNQPQ
jgi:hypothetical protein